MPRHTRKRQKVEDDRIHNDAEKDEEEKRLESMLFGTKFPSSVAEEVDEVAGNDAGNDLSNMLDSDLFFVDDGQPPAERPDDSDSTSESEEAPKPRPKPTAAWSDPSDPPSVSVSSDRRRRKLRDAPGEDVLTGREYESRLRRQFERINPEPLWARKARKSQKEKADGDEDENTPGVDEMLSSTTGVLGSKRRRGTQLEPGALSIERLRDVNANQGSTGGDVKCLAFHPSPQIPVLAVGSGDRRLRLYNIDGHTSPLLQTVHIPSMPFAGCHFHPNGSELLVTGSRPYYYTHDLQSGQIQQSKVWGSHQSDHNASTSMNTTAFSPSGNILAVAGRTGSIQLLDYKNSGQVITQLKCGSSGGVQSIWFPRGSGNDDQVAVLTQESEVYIWDFAERKCLRRWQDFGGFRGSAKVMTGSSDWLTTGSNSGLVNVYNSGAFSTSEQALQSGSNPTPAKTLSHITTSISTLRFNHDAQMLAVVSKEKKGSMRLVHFPSFTSFSNWPTSSTPLGHVTAVDFSAQSEYVAIGNSRGRVLLYWLRDYAAKS